jgi:hypothetical protein
MNLKEWTGAKVASLILLVVTAAIALALAAVVLYVGFGGGNIADLSAMSLDDILDLYGSLFAGEVGKGLSIFGWACVLLASICVLGVLRRFCPYFYNSMKVVRGWMSYSTLKKTLRTEVFSEPVEFRDMLGGEFGVLVSSSENWASESNATWVCFFTKSELSLSENNAACRPVCIPSRFVRYLNLKPMKVSDGQLKMYRPITAFELVLFDGRTITVGFATPEEVSSLKWSVMSMLPNAECVEDGSIDRKACRKLNWDFKKKYSFRFGAFRRDFLD